MTGKQQTQEDNRSFFAKMFFGCYVNIFTIIAVAIIVCQFGLALSLYNYEGTLLEKIKEWKGEYNLMKIILLHLSMAVLIYKTAFLVFRMFMSLQTRDKPRLFEVLLSLIIDSVWIYLQVIFAIRLGLKTDSADKTFLDNFKNITGSNDASDVKSRFFWSRFMMWAYNGLVAIENVFLFIGYFMSSSNK